MPLVLVSCCGPKLPSAAPARDLYQSQLFKMARAYAESCGHPWVILSAQHHVLQPGQVITPYDARIPKMHRKRLAWSQEVNARLLRATNHTPTTLISLCGMDYTTYMGPLEQLGYSLEYPLRGLAIGERLRWLKQQLA